MFRIAVERKILTAFALKCHRDINTLRASCLVQLAKRRVVGPICAADRARSLVIP